MDIVGGVDPLQELLDRSLAGAGQHLRSIVVPDERTLDARQVRAALTGVCHLAVATVTARGEPRVSAVDGHFLDDRFVFGTSADARKITHLRARPAVSVCHLRGDDLGVFVHGTAVLIEAGTEEFDSLDAHWAGVYGTAPSSWGPALVFARVEPHWMVAYAFLPDKFPAPEEPS